MLEEVQELKLLAIQAIAHESKEEEYEVNKKIDAFMVKHRYLILDILDDALIGGK